MIRPGSSFSFAPGGTAKVVERAIAQLKDARIVERIWAHDHTVWRKYPDEIRNRMGWLAVGSTDYGDIEARARAVRAEGFERAVVLGMGGASLVAEVVDDVFGPTHSGIPATVLDTTHPDAIARLFGQLNLPKTLFIFSMKKWALETYSLFHYAYRELVKAVGAETAPKHFIAITDVGAWVGPFVDRIGFRHIFYNDPYVGGRYAALTHVGLFPAALRGVNLDVLLARATVGTDACQQATISPEGNAGAWLGAVIGGLAKAGRDKLTFVASDSVASWLTWAEQLIAESLGKNGTGVVPVIESGWDDQSLRYGNDRLFVILDDGSDAQPRLDVKYDALVEAGHPVIYIRLRDTYDIAEQFVYWMFAVAVAGHLMGVQPFDQPNVEATKNETMRLLDAYRQDNKFPVLPNIANGEGFAIYGAEAGDSPIRVMASFVDKTKPGDYIAVLAYLAPNEDTTRALQVLQQQLHKTTGCATTVAYGPRYLHSTGQLHKGDRGNGHFLVITAEVEPTLPVPRSVATDEQHYTFESLLSAQALGDWYALSKLGRHIIRLHFDDFSPQTLQEFFAFLD